MQQSEASANFAKEDDSIHEQQDEGVLKVSAFPPQNGLYDWVHAQSEMSLHTYGFL